MFHSFFFYLVDPSAGRIGYASLSQQTLMELFIERILDTELISGGPQNPKDISEWPGVDVNDSHEVVAIDWLSAGFLGEIEFKWLPPTINNLVLFGNNFSGTLDFTALPDSLLMMDLSGNSFTGSLNLEHLPSQMIILTVTENSFSGSVNLTRLPKTLETLELNDNQLSGTLDLTKLPANLQIFTIRKNNFEGYTDFGYLPKIMWLFDVSHNALEGTITIKKENERYYTAEKTNVVIQTIE
mmetsp:Transcript_11333/g.17134  ORF Transcript_11333/g.17134 Transcript_11333/m.17134 type:complete len:241 (-) Transcript_11333:10-732(-)